MGVGEGWFLLVQVNLELDVGAALHVHIWDVNCLPDHHSQLKLLLWLWLDLNRLLLSLFRVFLVDLDPHLDDTLSYGARLVEQVSEFDGLGLHGLPAEAVVPVIEVYLGDSDQLVSEEAVVVPALYLEVRSSWEVDQEIKRLVEVWLLSVQLVVVAVTVLFLAAPEDQVRVRQTE